MQLDCLYSSLFFEHYNRILLWLSARTLQQCLFVWGCVMLQRIRTLPVLESLGISVLLCSLVVPSVTGLWTIVLRMCLYPCYSSSNVVAKHSVKKASVTLWFSLQCRCKTFCYVCFYQPALCRKCVFVRWTSCLRAKIHNYFYSLVCTKVQQHGETVSLIRIAL